MLFNLITVVVSLIAVLVVFLFMADKFINIGIKMAQKDAPKVKIMPTIKKKTKETPEAKALRERLEMIDSYSGYKEN